MIDYYRRVFSSQRSAATKFKKGDVIATIYSSSPENFDEAEKIISENTVISDKTPQVRPLVLAVAE